MANQDVRYYLNGLLFEFHNGTLTTVDDTVLALYTSPAGCAGPFTEPATALCSRRGEAPYVPEPDGGSCGCEDEAELPTPLSAVGR